MLALVSLLDMGGTLQALSVLAAPVFGLAGVWLGGHLQAKKDDERWRRELGREDERWNREDDRKWLDEKLHIYTGLLADLTQAFESSRRAYDPHAPYSTLRDDAEQTRLGTVAHADLTSADEALRASVLLAGPRVNQIAMTLRNSLLITNAMGKDAGTGAIDERLFEARVMLQDLRLPLARCWR